jgi:PAS domain S-box-containing protein
MWGNAGMQDLDAGERVLTGETQALHSRITKLEQVSHNLPGHKNVDEESDRAWRKWKSTFDAIKDSIILTDGELKIIQANLASSQLFGRPLDQVIGKTCWQLVHGTNEAPEECPLKRAKDTNKHEEMEVYLPQKGIWAADSVDPVLDKQGRLTGVVHIIRDITDRKQAEEVLRESEEKYRGLVENSPNLVAIYQDDTIKYVNKMMCEKLGWTFQEMTYPSFNPVEKIIPQRFQSLVKENIAKRLRGENISPYEVSIKTRDGSEIPVMVMAQRILYHGKPADEVIHIDITERKLAEEALRETTQTLQAVIQASPLPIFAVDRERIVKTWNPAAERTFGWGAQEVIGRKYPAIPEEKMDEADALFSRAMESGLTEVETLRQRKDGSLIDVSISAAPLRDSRGNINGVMAVITDITERKQAEQKLLEDQAQLKSLASQLTLAEEHERRRLATELHDRISQALVISKIKLDALRKSGRNRKLDKALEDICNSIGQTIRDTRTLTFDLGSPVLHELGFETAVSELLTDRIQKKHGITVEFEDDGEPKPLDDDVRILLFRDVRELLTNVDKHASAHKVKVSIRKVGSEIHISVEDDGWGFDTKKVAATAVREGGFGLFSIRERLENLGGHLQIDSAPGCGCKVTIMAPLKKEKKIEKGEQK